MNQKIGLTDSLASIIQWLSNVAELGARSNNQVILGKINLDTVQTLKIDVNAFNSTVDEARAMATIGCHEGYVMGPSNSNLVGTAHVSAFSR